MIEFLTKNFLGICAINLARSSCLYYRLWHAQLLVVWQWVSDAILICFIWADSSWDLAGVLMGPLLERLPYSDQKVVFPSKVGFELVLDTGIYIPVLLVMRQVGIIVGPLTIFWTQNWRFSLLGIPVDKFNSATLLIAILWMLVLSVNLAATHFEPRAISGKEKALANQSEETQLTIEDKQYKYIQVKPLPPLTEQIVICLVLSLSAYILQVTLLCSCWGLYFQSTLESMVTPLTRRLMGWEQSENAVFFMVVGILAVLGYLCVSVSYSMEIPVKTIFQALSKKMAPRSTLLLGAVVELFVVTLLTLILPQASFR